MLAGRIGENKYVVEYATDCRAKCKLFSCKRSLFLGELRIQRCAESEPLQNKRVHWYHPLVSSSRSGGRPKRRNS